MTTPDRSQTAAARRKEEERRIRRSRRLPDPSNYWAGSPGEPPICPENILLFSRQGAMRLMGSSPNQHHRHVLIVSLRGTGKIAVETRIHPLREGECLLVFPFQSHCYIELAPPEIEWLFLSFEHRSDARLDSLRDRGASPLSRAGREHLDHLLRGWNSRSGRETLPLRLGLWLHEMVTGTKRGPVPTQAAVPDSEADLVEKVNRLVHARRESPPSLPELAGALGVSGSSLRARFRAATGRSLGRHMREIRLNFACELLHDTRLRIEEISARCGYGSLFAFSRAFRNAQGCSPSQYRKRRVAGSGL